MLKGILKLVVGIVLVGASVFGAIAATGLAGDGLAEAMTATGNESETGASASRKAS